MFRRDFIRRALAALFAISLPTLAIKRRWFKREVHLEGRVYTSQEVQALIDQHPTAIICGHGTTILCTEPLCFHGNGGGIKDMNVFSRQPEPYG